MTRALVWAAAPDRTQPAILSARAATLALSKLAGRCGSGLVRAAVHASATVRLPDRFATSEIAVSAKPARMRRSTAIARAEAAP